MWLSISLLNKQGKSSGESDRSFERWVTERVISS